MISPVCTAGNVEAEASLVRNLLLRRGCAIHSLPCPPHPGLCRGLSGWVHGLEVRVGTRQSKWGSPSSLPASGEGLWSPGSKSYRLQNCPDPGSSGRHPAPNSQAQAVPACPRTRCEFPWEAQVSGLRPCSKCWQGSVGASPARCTPGAHSPR